MVGVVRVLGLVTFPPLVNFSSARPPFSLASMVFFSHVRSRYFLLSGRLITDFFLPDPARRFLWSQRSGLICSFLFFFSSLLFVTSLSLSTSTRVVSPPGRKPVSPVLSKLSWVHFFFSCLPSFSSLSLHVPPLQLFDSGRAVFSPPFLLEFRVHGIAAWFREFL